MAISLTKAVADNIIDFLANKLITGSNGSNSMGCDEEDPEDILNDREVYLIAGKGIEEQNNENSIEIECYFKQGRVSYVNDRYVIIENKYKCQRVKINFPDIEIGDIVTYYGYVNEKEEKLKITKVDSKLEEQWEPSWGENSDVVVKAFSACSTIVKAKVISRNKRIFTVNCENQQIKFNLDDPEIKFSSRYGVPVIGDFIKVSCLREYNRNSPKSMGSIVEILAINPSLSKELLGKITMYNETEKLGLINNKYFFKKLSCQNGYIPCMGDKVDVLFLESEQSIGENAYKFRAFEVSPLDDRYRIFRGVLQEKPLKSLSDLEKSQDDKLGIEITKDTELVLSAQEEKVIVIEITNFSRSSVRINKCTVHKIRGNTQLSILNSDEIKGIHLTTPQQSNTKCKADCKIKVVGSSIGTSDEWLSFDFYSMDSKIGFTIARKIKVSVNGTAEENVFRKVEMEVPPIHQFAHYIPGVRPYPNTKFIRKHDDHYPVPAYITEIIYRIINEKKSKAEAENIVYEEIPAIKEVLSYNNYEQRFHQLLYLEDIAKQIALARYKMKNAILRPSQEYLVLTVEGLAEKRPSLIVGDKVDLTMNSENEEDKIYGGYIHKVRATEIFLRFQSDFHQIYKGQECTVNFRCSRSVINRFHNAIVRARENLGEEVLFPTKVVPKDPQCNIMETHYSGEDFCSDEIILNGDADSMDVADNKLRRSKIDWVNKNLNDHQRKAVMNILKGIARPLPYIIFGPPGTGKTVTLCETVIQILKNVSNCRILVATPSNSSANLITTRLIDGIEFLKQDVLVRVVGHNYIDSENMPERILPYCATVDLSCEGTKQNVNILDPKGFTRNCTISYLTRHRIIIGTCAALGVFYNIGFRKDHFTHVIVDEAGQASEPEIMVPLSLVQASTAQIVLAGDVMQLGPVIISKIASYFHLSESYLSRLLEQFPYRKDTDGFIGGYDARLVTKLLLNYRSLPEILKLPNEMFYDSELIPQICPVESEEADLLLSLQNVLPNRLGDPPAIIFHGVQGENKQDYDSPSWYNQEEVDQVHIYLQRLLNNGVQPEDIGIITPYDKQVRKIRNMVREINSESTPKVGSVEEFQGQERKIIILSTVRSKKELIKQDKYHALGFVAAPKRLNVAITRARACLIIVGNPFLLEQDYYWRKVIKYCYENYAYRGCKNYVPHEN